MAAVLACGEGAALSHISAALLWQVVEQARPSRPHVSVPTYAGRRAPTGIQLHRSATLRPHEVTARNAIPVTTLERTLRDIAPALDDKRMKAALRQAERMHKLDLQHIRASLDALARCPQRLKRVLDRYVPAPDTEGDAEAAFLEICAQLNIRQPELQVPVGPYRADFMWPDLKLVVEIDDRSSHDGYIAFQEDRIRDRAFKAAGFDVLRFTRNEVLRVPAAVGQEVSAEVGRRLARDD